MKVYHPPPRSRRRLQLQLDDVIFEERQLHLRERRPRGIHEGHTTPEDHTIAINVLRSSEVEAGVGDLLADLLICDADGE